MHVHKFKIPIIWDGGYVVHILDNNDLLHLELGKMTFNQLLDIFDQVYHGDITDPLIVETVKSSKSYQFSYFFADREAIDEGKMRFRDCPVLHIALKSIGIREPDVVESLEKYYGQSTAITNK